MKKDNKSQRENETIQRRLEMKSHKKNLSMIRQELEKAAECCGFGENEIYQLKVAVSEAAANAIEHGSPHGDENLVTVTIECDCDKVVVEIADQGVFKARLPVTDGRPSHRGRGIFLMTALMDQVTINEQREGTVVRLVKFKEPPDKQQMDILDIGDIHAAQ